MKSDKINLILEKIEKIESRLDSIEGELRGEGEKEVSQSDNSIKLEEIKKEFRKEFQQEKSELKEREIEKLKTFLENKAKDSVIPNKKIPELWGDLMEVFKSEMSTSSFETWFSTLEPVAFVEDTLIVSVKNEFAQDWIETKFLRLLEKTTYQLTDKKIKFKFVTLDSDVVRRLI
ncbi:DnaA N-terminal domain-containing protein [Orenia marismortui]|uniref:DnaA N-terminal domain-containing protein n=1 Tax=Orenia marismortui TaxID=46469 RepID=UPI0003652C2B|nr:DnaA N-terminal domain-containing protein [Orenia marismortui]